MMPSRFEFFKHNYLHFILFSFFATYFLVYRWHVRMEPMGSDDLTLLQYATQFTDLEHWFFKPIADPGHFYPNHQSLRLSVFLFSTPLLLLFGPTSLTFYLMPLLFAFLGFLIVWRIVSRTSGLFFASLIALIHIYFPFEIIHSSFFLVDLPAAVLLLLCPLLLVIFSEYKTGESHKACLYGFISGLSGFLSYLFRSNGLFFLGLTLTMLFIYKRHRKIVLWCIVWLSIFVLLEQMFYVALHLDFGFRWKVVSRALDNYAKFLPTYGSLDEFLFRCFRSIQSTFGRGAGGSTLLAAYVLALILHPISILCARSSLIKAVAVLGFAVWGVFSLGIYEWNDTQIRAMAPPNHRYFQPFYYSSLVLFGWAGAVILDMSSKSISDFKNKGVLLRLIMVVPVIVFVVQLKSTVDTRFKNILSSPTSEVQAAVESIDDAASVFGTDELKVFSTARGNRVLKLFRNEQTSPKVYWQYGSMESLIQQASTGHGVFALDIKRLNMDVRYQSGLAAIKLENQLNEFYQLLDANYTVHPSTSTRFLVYSPMKHSNQQLVPISQALPGTETK